MIIEDEEQGVALVKNLKDKYEGRRITFVVRIMSFSVLLLHVS